MIQSFADEQTEAFYRTGKTTVGYQMVAKIALRKLDMMDAAKVLDDLRVPPATSWRSCGVAAAASTASASTTSVGFVFDGPKLDPLTSRLLITTERSTHAPQAQNPNTYTSRCDFAV